MPAVFVHGVPETKELWDGVRERLSRRDTVALSLPGFGVAVPEGFGATKEEYLEWLVEEVRAVGEPVDIVGHDWGALLVGRLVCVRPELVRAWAAGGGAIDEDYVWHNVARLWQTPGVGEQVMQSTTPEAMAAALANEGVPPEAAQRVAEHFDGRMKACILPLYRSAVSVGKEWGTDLDGVSRPGLLVWGEKDPYMPVDFARRMARRTQAWLVVLEGCGHWWPLQRPDEAARALEEFWLSQDAGR